jgi:hypothetical protein
MNQRSDAAYAQLALQLCEAIATLIANTTTDRCGAGPSSELAPNDHEEVLVRLESDFRDAIGLRDLLAEFGLNQPQVRKLRERWGFPAPLRPGRPLLFSRTEVERWARVQPNKDNLAIVLRRRKRRVPLQGDSPGHNLVIPKVNHLSSRFHTSTSK